MKKLIFLVAISGVLLSSCNEKEKKAETNEAEDINVVKNETTQTYKTIKGDSFVEWRASHLGGVQPRFGKIFLKDAEISVTDNKISNADIKIDMNSLTVENFEDQGKKNKLTVHLKGSDFFQTDSFSISKFELTNIEKVSEDFNTKITGNLTIMNVTKSITFNAKHTISEKEISIHSEDFTVDRSDWGLSYNADGTEGVPVDYLIADDIGFTINITVTK